MRLGEGIYTLVYSHISSDPYIYTDIGNLFYPTFQLSGTRDILYSDNASWRNKRAGLSEKYTFHISVGYKDHKRFYGPVCIPIIPHMFSSNYKKRREGLRLCRRCIIYTCMSDVYEYCSWECRRERTNEHPSYTTNRILWNYFTRLHDILTGHWARTRDCGLCIDCQPARYNKDWDLGGTGS